MLFNTVEFIIFFTLVLVTISIIKHRKFQHLFLLFVSYFFFYFSSNYLIVLLIYSTVLDFYLGKEIWKSESLRRKKILLAISLAGNLSLLGFFKYADFAILQFNILGNYINLSDTAPFLNLALPIGISFYTFQTISYTVDIYRGQLTPSKSLREFALFVSFFPQLVAGPIVRAKDFLPQLREKLSDFETGKKLRQISIHDKNLKLGITIMAFGFLKKMFFADNIAPIANDIFANSIGATSLEIWLGTIAFSFQIYGDFSGYSDIAIGAALILGFKLPLNFNKPYFATSPSDFWKRWHISLSTWLRDYLYIPLGGNKKSFGRTYVNLFSVMVLGGLWHGAAVNFIIWGTLHGLYLAFHKILQKTFPKLSQSFFFKTKLGKIMGISITQYFVLLAWIPFRVQDTNNMVYSMNKFILVDFETLPLIEFISTHELSIFILVLFITLHFISFTKRNVVETISKYNLKIWVILLTVISLSIVLFYNGRPEDFIYFRF
jgi:alginate O-acetyltransferase complex protein AlgI